MSKAPIDIIEEALRKEAARKGSPTEEELRAFALHSLAEQHGMEVEEVQRFINGPLLSYEGFPEGQDGFLKELESAAKTLLEDQIATLRQELTPRDAALIVGPLERKSRTEGEGEEMVTFNIAMIASTAYHDPEQFAQMKRAALGETEGAETEITMNGKNLTNGLQDEAREPVINSRGTLEPGKLISEMQQDIDACNALLSEAPEPAADPQQLLFSVRPRGKDTEIN